MWSGVFVRPEVIVLNRVRQFERTPYDKSFMHLCFKPFKRAYNYSKRAPSSVFKCCQKALAWICKEVHSLCSNTNAYNILFGHILKVVFDYILYDFAIIFLCLQDCPITLKYQLM